MVAVVRDDGRTAVSEAELSQANDGSGKPQPFLELRVGGLHLTVQHVPYKFLTLLVTAGGALGAWFAAR
ncbi:hypothetical protein PV350_34275 [Streptomyces sp. PA03-6a]|nr:hypothetical protein [Streptomyces sp. PA03-6a]